MQPHHIRQLHAELQKKKATRFAMLRHIQLLHGTGFHHLFDYSDCRE